MTCPSHWEVRTHLKTGEPVRRYIDWSPSDLPERTQHGVIGRPLREFEVCADRIEITETWCHSSGHAEWYDSDPPRIVRRDDEAERSELARRFGEQLAGEIELAFSSL